MKRLLLVGSAALISTIAVLAAFFYTSREVATEASSSIVSSPAVDVAALRARAEQGEARAQVQLGRLYAKGESVAPSFSDAAKWYERAASQGNAEGQLALGELFEAGQGVSLNITQAIKLYRLAAEQGLASAEYTLGFMYEAGRGMPTDHAEASRWFRRAAEQGDPLAQYDLGQRYDLGVGVQVDKVEAYKWLTLAAAQGQRDSADRLKKVAAKMTRADIKEAKHRVAEFSAGKSVAH